MQRTAGAIVLREADHAVLDEDDFGVPGLVAHEWIGPFVHVQGVGPLIMVHERRLRAPQGHHASPAPLQRATSALRLDLGEGEGGVLFPLEGRVTLDGEVLGPEALAVLPPALDHRSRVVCSDAGARVLRVTFGLGNGLIVRSR